MTVSGTRNAHTQPSAVKKVVDYIAQEIYDGNLVSGDRIPTEAELCAMLQISRTPVREAVKFLESQTVLRTKQGSGTFVADPEEISISMPLNFKIKLEGISWVEIVAFRNQMEFLVLREAIQNVTEADIQRLEAINNQLLEVRKMKPVPVQEAQKLELLFHDELLNLSNNRLLQEMYRISSEFFNPAITKLYNYTAEGIDNNEWPLSHTYFLDALRKRDIFLAYQVTLNLIPVEKFESFLGPGQYTPDSPKKQD
ncbi:GntR family transcriptional regulator [uncultured Oscillibacter sp.]|uniref:FadR/GntR family transcriptional regulator n=1 Tax=uncultured Oscillibacter sp. TaxID=876091 RepID=UPI002804504D|nr:GntR family transcriptional regulator [uncultured Oscillibacter sp.]